MNSSDVGVIQNCVCRLLSVSNCLRFNVVKKIESLIFDVTDVVVDLATEKVEKVRVILFAVIL